MSKMRYGTDALRRRMLQYGALSAMPLRAWSASPAVMRVGRDQAVKSLASAAQQARDGMVIEVDAGDYVGDVAVWQQHDLTLRAVGGRARMIAAGQSAQGKGIFVTSGERMRIEGFDFIGATVPDHNGAGIRFERGSLVVRDCTFRDNENGLLAGNDKTARLEIEDCDFGTIVRQQGQTHNCYVGTIAYLKVTGSYFHHGRIGHLLKSRAAVNHIFYNNLSDEIGGEASYELEFPNGGQALVVGNIIQQSSTTQNSIIISYGSEGYAWPRQELQLVNNTVIDMLPRNGSYLRVAPGEVQVRLINNLWAGNPYFAGDSDWEQRNNFTVDWDAFVMALRGNYALRAGSPLRGKAVDPGASGDVSLHQASQFRAPRGTLALNGPARNPGAVQIP